MPIGHLRGYDLTLDDRLGLNLFRDGRTPALVGGRYGAGQAVRSSGGAEFPVTWDRLDGGIGATERLVPYTFPLAIDGCTRFPRVWTPGGQITTLGSLPNGAGARPAGEIRAIANDGTDLLVGAGGVLIRATHAGVLSVEFTVGATEEIQDVLLYNGMLVVGTVLTASGAPGKLYVKQGGGAWVSGTASRQHLIQTYMKIDGVESGWRLIANDTRASFKFIAASTAADLIDDTAWTSDGGAGWPVGSTSSPITDLVGAPLVMFFCKTDGIYHVGPDGRAARIVDWSDSVHPENGRASFFAYGSIFASNHRWGLVQVDVANLNVQWQTQAAAPGSGYARVTPISGPTTALCMDGEWLVGPVYNGTDSFVCYGRPTQLAQRQGLLDLNSPQTLDWHGSEATFWGQRVTSVRQASLGPSARPLLWVGTLEGATPKLHHVSLPALGTPLEDFLMGGPHRFATDSWLYLPREDYGGTEKNWAARKKVFTQLEANAEYLERYVAWIDAYMTTAIGHLPFWDRALDPNDTLWTQIGRMDSGDRALLRPSTAVQSGTRAAVMFHGHGEAEHPFAYYSATLSAIPVIEQAARLHFRVTAGRARKANQAPELGSRELVLNQLWALQWADPVSLVGRDGLRLVGKVEEGMSWQETVDPQTKELVTAVTFDFKVLRRPFIWGSGARWGTDIMWS